MKDVRRKDTRKAIRYPTRRRYSDPIDQSSCRVAVVGAAGVGKSALTVQFICGRFLSEYDPTLEDTYTKDVPVNGREIKVHVLDTAGNDGDESLSLAQERQLRSNDAFIIVYSETDRQSFEAARHIHSNIVRCCTDRGIQNVPIALVGNKTDLPQCRQVNATEGEELAQDLGHRCRFFRTSAAQSHVEIDAAVQYLVKERIDAYLCPKKRPDKKHACPTRLKRSISLQEFGLKRIQKSIFRFIPGLS